MSKTVKGITVILATHNRSDILRRTLQGLVDADRCGLEIDVVVADNNSSDDTRSVVDGFAAKHPVHYLFVADQGRNRALNRAVEATDLHDIVVLTDDDVIIPTDWFRQIAEACNTFPEISVFGGRIHARWPDDVPPPNWAHDPFVREFGFAVHDFGDSAHEYPPGVYPFGPNIWVRSTVFEEGHRHREQIVPQQNATLGSETVFLIDLERAGYRMLYWPAADVGHQIRPEQLEPGWIIRRAEIFGTMFPHVNEPPRPEQRYRNPRLWRLTERLALAHSTLRCWFAVGRPGDPNTRVVRRVWATFHRALHAEALRLPAARNGLRR